MKIRVLSIALIFLFLFPFTAHTDKTFPDTRLVSLPGQIPDIFLSQWRRPSDVSISKGKFLVAGRNMQDPRFSETVILLIQYDHKGALGLIINRPTEVKLSAVLPDVRELQQKTDRLFIGGPVSVNQTFVLLRSDSQVQGAERVFGNVRVSAYLSVLRSISRLNPEGKSFRVYAGCASWMPGQLDMEIARGDWHILQADADTIFEKELSDIWPELILLSTSLTI